VRRVAVHDPRFDFLVKTFSPKSEIKAVLTITDIAGLVKGASEGKGLGNAFLSHIAAVDGIYHLVRGFADAEVEHVEGNVDPVRDLKIISDELVFKDLQMVRSRKEVVARQYKVSKKDPGKKHEMETLNKAEALLEKGTDIRAGTWDNKEIEVLNEVQLLTSKSVVYLVNLAQKNFEEQKSKWIGGIRTWCAERTPGAPVIPFSATFENKIAELDDAAREKYCVEKKSQSMLPKIITTGYHTLDLVHFFTCGADEVRAWTVRRGTAAPQAGGVIHSDFEKGFIACETMSYDDFVRYGSEHACKAAGRYRTEGKLYIVRDGDILFFKHGTITKGKSTKKAN